nr:calcium-binding protein [Azospirillum argentinense]
MSESADVKKQSIGGKMMPIFGTPEADLLEGTSGDDHLVGLEGNDTLIGGDGDDFLSGNEGDDLIYIDAQDRYFFGDEGYDTLVVLGSDGVTANIGLAGFERAFGSAGNDALTGIHVWTNVEIDGRGAMTRSAAGTETIRCVEERATIGFRATTATIRFRVGAAATPWRVKMVTTRFLAEPATTFFWVAAATTVFSVAMGTTPSGVAAATIRSSAELALTFCRETTATIFSTSMATRIRSMAATVSTLSSSAGTTPCTSTSTCGKLNVSSAVAVMTSSTPAMPSA